MGFADSKKQKDCASTIPKSRYFLQINNIYKEAERYTHH